LARLHIGGAIGEEFASAGPEAVSQSIGSLPHARSSTAMVISSATGLDVRLVRTTAPTRWSGAMTINVLQPIQPPLWLITRSPR